MGLLGFFKKLMGKGDAGVTPNASAPAAQVPGAVDAMGAPVPSSTPGVPDGAPPPTAQPVVEKAA